MMMVFWKSGHVGKAQRIQVSGNAVLSVLLDSGRLDSASKLFAEMPPTSATSYTAMIDRFSRSIRVTEARYLFDSSPSGDRNVFSWAAMMSCSASNDEPLRVVRLFENPYGISLSSTVLKSCGCLRSLVATKRIHSLTMKLLGGEGKGSIFVSECSYLKLDLL